MTENIGTKKLTKNLILSISAQIISLVTSFVLGFIVPKFIDEYQYSYWQTFVLYVSYAGVLHFGLLDGLVLRYSQYDYDELDKARIRSQFQFLLFFTTLCCIGTCFVSSLFTEGVNWQIFVLVSIGIITKNIFGYTSYTYQMTNRIKQYAFLVIAQRLAYAVFVAVLLLLGVQDFYWYCIAELFGDMVGITIGFINNKGLYFGRSLPIKETLKEVWVNVSCGIMLMIANFSSSLLVGGAKMVIQWRWDTLIFGKVSFAFSVSNLFLTFVTAISVVLFPSLKRMKEEELPQLYGKIRGAISPLLLFVIIFYFPGCWILEKWLPAYSASLVYLGILLPLIIFSSKVSLLTNNYLKAYRKEKLMLIINVASVAIGLLAYLFGAYVLNSLEFILYATVFVIMGRSVASEIAVMKIIGKNGWFDFIAEFLMTLIFMLSVQFLSRWWACLVYGCALLVYGIIYRKSIVALFRSVTSSFKRKNVAK